MNDLLRDRVAIISGAGSGVGEAAADLFVRHGASVLALDIHEPTLNAVVSRIAGQGGAIRGRLCDVGDPAAVEAAVAEAVSAFGRLDVMFNNAGIAVRTPSTAGTTTFLDATMDQFRRMADVNIGGVVNGCQAAVRQFQAQGGGGAIVNTASLAGLMSYGSPLYSATKGAVVALTRTLALEYAREGIRVNAVCPAVMFTPFGVGREGSYPEAVQEWARQAHPLGRAIDPIDCANGALFLASDMAANITGHNLPIDGGLLAGVKI